MFDKKKKKKILATQNILIQQWIKTLKQKDSVKSWVIKMKSFGKT